MLNEHADYDGPATVPPAANRRTFRASISGCQIHGHRKHFRLQNLVTDVPSCGCASLPDLSMDLADQAVPAGLIVATSPSAELRLPLRPPLQLSSGGPAASDCRALNQVDPELVSITGGCHKVLKLIAFPGSMLLSMLDACAKSRLWMWDALLMGTLHCLSSVCIQGSAEIMVRMHQQSLQQSTTKTSPQIL